MNVALIIPSLSGGGAERVMVTYANGLQRAGHKVFIFTHTPYGAYSNEIHTKINVISIPYKNIISYIVDTRYLLQILRIQCLLSSMTHVNYFAILQGKLIANNIQVIIRESNTVSEILKLNNSYKFRILDKIRRWVYTSADMIIAPSEGVSLDLSENYHIAKLKISTIPNPVDYNYIQKLSKSTLEDKYVSKIEGKKIILGIGSLSKQKNFQDLIYAFKYVRSYSDAYLIILGDGPERSNLEILIRMLNLESYVYMPGYVDNPFNYLKRSDVFVLSSIYEGLPNVLIHALLLGKKCISTDCPSGPSEILENGKYGQLVQINNRGELGKSMQKMLNKNPPLNNVDHLIAKYSVDSVMQLLLKNKIFKYGL
jgi:glycosyltransferase involved in cell wall biosynthesis